MCKQQKKTGSHVSSLVVGKEAKYARPIVQRETISSASAQSKAKEGLEHSRSQKRKDIRHSHPHKWKEQPLGDRHTRHRECSCGEPRNNLVSIESQEHVGRHVPSFTNVTSLFSRRGSQCLSPLGRHSCVCERLRRIDKLHKIS